MLKLIKESKNPSGINFWKSVSNVLNKEGPAIKSGDTWRSWFKNYKKRQNRCKTQTEEYQTNGVKVSEKQILILITAIEKEKINVAGCDTFWEKMSVVLNKEGPSRKCPKIWRRFYLKYKKRISNLIKDGALPTLTENTIIHQSEKDE